MEFGFLANIFIYSNQHVDIVVLSIITQINYVSESYLYNFVLKDAS